MRVCLATPLYPPESGGPATFAKALENELPKHGWSGETVRFGSVRRYPPGMRHAIYFWHVFAAARRADLVLALDPLSVGLPALLAARLARKPFYLRVAGDYAWEQGTARFGLTESLDRFVCAKSHPLPVRALRAVQSFVASSSYRIIVPSRYLAKIVHLWDIPRERIVVAHNGAPDVAGIVPSKREQPYFISIGRLVRWKGMVPLVRAFAKVHAEHPELELVIVGDGPDRANAEAAAAEAGILPKVLFTGALPRSEALALLAGAAGLVLNSRYEGFSHTILEAFALGVPVATTSAGGNPELVESGKTGFVFAPDDTDAMARAMRAITEDGAHAQSLAREAKERASAHTEERMVAAVLSAIAPAKGTP